MGNLLVMATRWELTNPDTATITSSFNNATAVRSGDDSGLSQARHNSFNYGINSDTTVPIWLTDEASIATYGRREGRFTDTSLTSQAAMIAAGSAVLSGNSTPMRQASLICYQSGLQAGQQVNISSLLYGLVAKTFRIQQISITYPIDNTPTFTVQFADAPVTLTSQMRSKVVQR